MKSKKMYIAPDMKHEVMFKDDILVASGEDVLFDAKELEL